MFKFLFWIYFFFFSPEFIIIFDVVTATKSANFARDLFFYDAVGTGRAWNRTRGFSGDFPRRKLQ